MRGLLFVFPTLLVMVSNPTSHRHLEQLAPMNAGMGIQTTVDLHSLPLSPWAVGALALGALVLQRRDAEVMNGPLERGPLGDSHDELPVVAFT